MIGFLKENKIIFILIAVYFLIFAALSSLRHYTFQTQTWDLAVFEQSFWQTLHGKFMYNIFENKNHFAVHFSPFLVILVPLYALWQSPYLLLISQSLALALAALPLYLLAKDLLNKKWAIVTAILYLIYPSLHWLNLFDFHEVPFAIPLILAAFYFLNKNDHLKSGIFLILTALVAENMIVAVFFIGLYLFLFKNRKLGLAVASASLIYFILVGKILMPALGGGIVRLYRYAQFGQTATEIIIGVITQPALTFQTIFTSAKMLYLLKIFLSAAFLPIIAWPTLILLVPGLLQNLLTSLEFQFVNFYQYDSIIIPFIFIGAIFGLKKLLATKIPEKLLLGLIIILAAAGFLWNSILSPLNFPLPRYTNERAAAFRKIIKLIPAQTSVASHTNLVPHLAHREYIYMNGFEQFLVDYVILDGQDLFGFPNQQSFDQYFNLYKQSGQYEILTIDNRYYILKRISNN